MTELLKPGVLIVWLLLVMLTAISWYLSIDMTATNDGAHQVTSSVLLVLALFKVRLVIMHFMEIATAPVALRLLFDVWVVAVCSLLIGMYWWLPLVLA